MAEERKSQAQLDAEGLSGLADRMNLSDEDREGFMESVMSKLGHKRSTSWLDAEPEGNSKGGSSKGPWGY